MNLSPRIKSEKFEARKELVFDNKRLTEISVDTVFELIRDIKDPEHSFSLEELRVVRKEFIKIYQITGEDTCLDIGLPIDCISVEFEPTIPHCSMAAIIGLAIKILLKKYIRNYLINVSIVEGTHVNDKFLNKQLNDKDRVQAASENESLMEVIDECTFFIQNKYDLK
jgi:metal-sulfur cluster biosynthetic enzyme